jgi:hypothetical protein
MPQHLGVHPDDLLPPGHAARQLDPDEIHTIAEHAEDWISTNEIHYAQALYQLPQIPADSTKRRVWAAGLSDRDRATYEDVEKLRAHLKPLHAAVHREDWRAVLDLLTETRPGDVEWAVRPYLYDIRSRVEQRYKAAVEEVLTEAAGEKPHG